MSDIKSGVSSRCPWAGWKRADWPRFTLCSSFFVETNLVSDGYSSGKGRNEGVTIPRASNHREGPRKVSAMQQVLSSVRYVYFRKTSGSNIGAQTCFLPSRRHLTLLRHCFWVNWDNALCTKNCGNSQLWV